MTLHRTRLSPATDRLALADRLSPRNRSPTTQQNRRIVFSHEDETAGADVLTIAELLNSQCRNRPDALALLAPGRPPATYADLRAQLVSCAAALREAGLGHGARVAVAMPNGPEAATAALTVAACATCAPLNPSYQAAEFRFYLEDARASAVIVPRGEQGPIRAVAAELGLAVLELSVDDHWPAGRFELLRAEPVARGASNGAEPAGGWPSADDVALILHTSGTTARPKIVPLSQANLVSSARSIAAHLALTPDDRGLNVMPLFHIHGLVGSLLSTLAAGGSLVCTTGFDEGMFFDWVADFAPTWYSAVPTIHQAIAANGAAYRRRAPAHRFRFVRSSSAALPPTTLEALEALLEAPVIEAYGMTEASHQMTSNPLPPRVRKPGSVGLPAGVEIAILDDAGHELAHGETGEISIRGPGVTAGYENNPEANARAFTRGWLRTGDQGSLDADGYLRVSGRLKEIVNRGGEKISPREIDEALLEHPDVAQATSFAMPHPSLGEDLVAAVVPKAGRNPGEAALRQFLFTKLAGFKVPSQIVFIDAIPKGPTGKIQRTSLHEKLGHALARPFVGPRSETERAVEAIIREVLKTEPLGVDANFFAAGGDSLRGTQVIARVNERLSLDLPFTAIFRHPTIAELACAVEEAKLAAESRTASLQAEIDALSDEEVERLLAELERADEVQAEAGHER
jgi:acyl-CoA synthetase (AMP-forming)/AMP-acid ligase II/acyl carrier protein